MFKSWFLLIKFLAKKILKRLLVKDWVMARVACMGKDAYFLTELPYQLVNIQKGRIDGILNYFNTGFHLKAIKYIIRDDIKELIFEQSLKYSFKRRKPKFILIDSYSELTDQKFRTTKNKVFYSNYNDINHDSEFSKHYECYGLLDIKTAQLEYIRFIEHYSKKYSNLPIIYLNFPTSLDTREKFKKRGDELLRISLNLSHIFKNFHALCVPKEIVKHNENDTYPYHYNSEVYSWLAKEIKNIYDKEKNN